MITLPKLPWEQDALEPNISKEIIHYHYDKHHKAYVDNLNKLIKDTEYENMSLGQIIAKANSGPIFNNAAQIFNHTFYWHSMSPNSKFDSKSEIGKQIIKDFKSIDKFEKEFLEKGKKLFGSGWIFVTKKNNKIVIVPTHNADGPPGECTLLFVMDVWEHGYYLQYKNERPKYIEAFCKIINWKFADENFTAA